MAGRAATAVKSKSTSKPRASAKTTKAKTATAKSTASKARVSKTKKSSASEESAETKVAVAEKPTRTRRKAKVETRTRIYWAVFNQALKRVAVFEFDQKGEAEKRAAKLQKSSGEDHFIQKIKATVSA
jgi:pullulanase/glycogen debranching enzyme